jgi:transposase
MEQIRKFSGERKRYSDSFKRKVILEHLSTGTPKEVLQNKHGIAGKSAILKWMRSYGHENVYGLHVRSTTTEMTKHSKKAPVNQSDSQNEQELRNRIRELERALEDEQLRSEAYKLTIEIAEREFNIPIRKKRSTK